MSFQIRYSTIGRRISLSVDFSAMQGKDKVHLLIDLLAHLGVNKALMEGLGAEEFRKVEKIFAERFEAFWEAK